MSITAVLDRIDVLLQDTDPAGTQRRLSRPLVKVDEWIHDIDDAGVVQNDPLSVYYLLLTGDVLGTPLSPISGAEVLREENVSLELGIYCGGHGTTTESLQALLRRLSEVRVEIQALLEDPNNYQRPTSKWYWAHDFSGSAPQADGDRVYCTVEFVVMYASTHTAL